MLQAPPISILIDQEVIETSTTTSDGMNKKSSYIDQALFSLSCSIDDKDGPVLLPLDVNVKLDTPTAFPQRTQISLMKFKTPTPTTSDDGVAETNGDLNGRPSKRQKNEMNGNGGASAKTAMEDVMEEASRLSELLSATVDSLPVE